MGKTEYLSHSRVELLLIAKAWETKLKTSVVHQRNAMLNAYANAHRKKNAKFIQLWDEAEVKITAEQIVAQEEIFALCNEMFSNKSGGDND